MKIFLWIVVPLAFLIQFTGCSDNEKATRISSIDSMITVCDTMLADIGRLEIDSANHYYIQIYNNRQLFQKKLDSIPPGEAVRNMLFQYGGMEKSFKKMPKKLFALRDEIKLSVKQLSDLKQDFQNNVMEDSTFLKYYREEELILQKICGRFNDMHNVFNKQLAGYRELRPMIEAFTDSLRQTEDKIHEPLQ
ncbi:MAG: hypothetical protein ABIJ16_07850 [Bacteroidota bacterium]